MTVPRVAVALAALPGLPDGRFHQVLRDYQAELAQRAGPAAQVLSGVALPGAESDEENYGRIAPMAGFLQLTLSGGDLRDLVTALRGAADDLAETVDPERSALVAGEGYLVQTYEGNYVYAMLARRNTAVTEAELTAWWINHGEIAVEALAMHDFGYEQLHGRDALTAEAGKAAGFPDASFALFETMSTDNIEALMSRFNEQTAERALADEEGYLDRAGVRGQWTFVVDHQTAENRIRPGAR